MRKRKWPVVLGLVLTGLWVLVPTAILFYEAGGHFRSMDPNQWGDFLSGIAAPPALLWLVIGYFQHGKEIELQQEELRRQVQETAHLVAQSERHAEATEELVQITRTNQEAEKLHQLHESSPKFELVEIVIGKETCEAIMINLGGAAHKVKTQHAAELPQVDCRFASTLKNGDQGTVVIHGIPTGSTAAPVRFSLQCFDVRGYEHFFQFELQLFREESRCTLHQVTHAAFEHFTEPITDKDGTVAHEPRTRMVPLPGSI
ncbi:MAG: hypothetical protein OXU42_09845 [Deltaproteobacteria bacterium]|nr:hypothetical protein [Deltaproteobacteria bacterium]